MSKTANRIIKGMLIRETDKAYLFRVRTTAPDIACLDDKQIWFAKKGCELYQGSGPNFEDKLSVEPWLLSYKLEEEAE